jgi:tight adherence protein C
MSIAIIVVAIAVVMLALLATLRLLLATPSRTSRTLGQIGAYGFSAPPAAAAPGEAPERPRTLASAATALGDALARRQGAEREKDTRQRLIAAGLYTQTPRAFFAAQALTAGLLLLLWIVAARFVDVGGVVYILGMPAAFAGGWALPTFMLSRRIEQRYHEIDKALPNLIDLLVVTVEAGIGFVGSMRLAAEQLEGPLGDELRLTLQDQNMGATTDEALKNLAQRADTPGIRAFVRAIVQGELLGVSIAQILRNLASDMRKKRRARAEEQAQKAPVKMLFPLVILIFPAMFIVLLLPALIQIKNTLGSG